MNFKRNHNKEQSLKSELLTKFKTNNEIQSSKLLVITENGEKLNLSLSEAVLLAQQQKLDLIEVAVKDDVSICKFGLKDDFLYKQLKLAKTRKQTSNHKVVKLKHRIDDADLARKINQIEGFLSSRCTVEIKVIMCKKLRVNGQLVRNVDIKTMTQQMYETFEKLNYSLRMNKDLRSFTVSYKK